MYKINNQLFDTASATTAVAKQQHKRLPKSQVFDGPLLHRRGRQPQRRQPHRGHHLLLTLRGPPPGPLRGPSADSNSISSFDSPTLSTYGSKFRGFIFKYTICLKFILVLKCNVLLFILSI